MLISRKTLEIAHVVIESTKLAIHVRASLETLKASGLSIYPRRDYGGAAQYEIEASRAASLARHAPAAALYLPLRVVVGKGDAGSKVEYDLPSSLFGQFGDARLTEGAWELDVALSRILSAAAA